MKSADSILNNLEQNTPYTTSADFSNIDLSKLDFKRLNSILRTNTNLKSLSLLESGISEADIPPLHKALLGNQYITDFQIQKYQNYSTFTLKLIDEMENHVTHNAQSQSNNSLSM